MKLRRGSVATPQEGPNVIRETHLKSSAHRILLLTLAGLVLSPVGRLQATLVQPLTLPEMVRRSTTIVHGTVQEVHTEWEDGRSRLYTYVTVSAAEFLKGSAANGHTITFRQLGGRDGDTIIYVPGSPRFGPKQEVLLFLTGEDSGGYPRVMGIFQGAFRPVPGPRGDRRVDRLTPGAQASLTEAGKPPTGGSFGDFLAAIRSLVKEQARDPAR